MSRPGGRDGRLSRRTRWNLDPPRCRAIEAPPPATRTKSKANHLPSESSTWAAVHLGAGQFSELFWRRVLRGTAYLHCNCSVVVGVLPSPFMSGWCPMLGGV